jgi:hypothetical protein
MLWIAKRVGVDKRTMTLARALCAKTVIHLMKDPRSIKAVEVAEAYGRGDATDDELSAAAADADAAYAYAYADAYAYAADAAAAYADAAAAAADAAAADDADAAAYADAAAAAYAAAYAAAADAAARKKSQMDTANICREVLTNALTKLLNP